jgi:hypothetical protein
MGKWLYNITLQLPQLPCDASPSCVDYIGSICQQQGVGFYYQMRMTQGSGEGWVQLLKHVSVTVSLLTGYY